MLQNIIGRKREIELIENCLNSNKPEFIAIYGRRRIGKTYLVKQLLGEKFSFYMTGVYQCSKNEMLAYFSEQLALYSRQKQARPKTRFERTEPWDESINPPKATLSIHPIFGYSN